MKKIIKILVFVNLFVLNIGAIQSQNVHIYDEFGNKIYFQKTENEKFITINSTVNQTKRELIKQKLNAYGNNFQEAIPFVYKVTLNSQQKALLFSQLNQDTVNVKITPMLMYSDSTVQWTSNEIIVKIHNNSNLETILNNHSISYSNIRQLGSDLQVFVVTLSSGTEDRSIEYSNMLYESGDVVFAQPAFWKYLKKYNSLYPNQWGLNNIGQNGGIAGIDINAPEAWQLATGTNVKVAVIDEGVNLTHSDLISNLLPGYDATNGALGGSNGSCKGNDAHGTNCAGIVAAVDNNVGIKGVAYNSKIIPIRIAYGNQYNQWTTNDTWIADGIYNAWYNKGADVLSNSWGGGSSSAAINNEINNALTQGRNGNGCVVVFASGNNNSGVSYPANSNPSILVVGAMSPCGERKRSSSNASEVNPGVTPDPSGTTCDGEKWWGSNYGSQLDIVAPGVLIPSTDITGSAGYSSTDYYMSFNGTSSACPHVAGVAALVLSVNPNLTGQQVRDIIESTAQKVRTDLYSYTTTTGHSNGTWNNQMGYGLVDAYAAVQAAKATLPPDLMIRDFLEDDGTEPNTYEACWTSPDVWVRNSNDNGLSMQNPEYHPSTPNWVYVRVKNRGGNYTGGANLKLYWAKASTALSWPYYWTGNHFPDNGPLLGNIVGTLTIPAMQQNEETILKFAWLVPDPRLYHDINTEPWHFCLLARIESTDDPMTFPETADLPANTRNNNNIGWRNTTVIDAQSNQISGTIAVANPFAYEHKYDLTFKAASEEIGKKIFEEAEINIALDKTILKNWIAGGKKGTNIKEKDGKTIIITGQNATLENLTFAPNEIGTVDLRFNFLTKEITDKEDYTYSVIQKDTRTQRIIGGETYSITKNPRTLFFADAGDGKEVYKDEPFTLNAALISEPAIYNWYDEKGNLIYEGADFSTSVEVGKKFKLEVIALADGYKDYAEVEVTVKPNVIKTLYPNPVTNNIVNIDYSINEAATAYISVMNYYYPQICNNYILNIAANQISFDTAAFPAGIYVVTLICDGEIADSKFLIKQ
ncbi:MAG: S8 family peptidase [Prevotellaceae bacterium]|jgi:subtilisin family serine protease|nr:S8 family peptidase [Prevotellaceae bacterium]